MADPKSAPLPPSPYINLMQVSHGEREFFLSFAQIAPENPGVAQLVARVVTTPSHAKAILRALQDNIRRYEEKFGEIPESPRVPQQKIQ